jgi:hypothetical protein
MGNTTVLTFAVLIIAGFLLAMKICFASKCDEVKLCCGLLSIHRNVSVENPEITNNESLSSQFRQMRNYVNTNSEVGHIHEVEDV